MATSITETQLRAILREYIQEHGIEALVEKTQKTEGYLRIVSAKNSTRRISNTIADALGYKMIEVNQRVYEPTT